MTGAGGWIGGRLCTQARARGLTVGTLRARAGEAFVLPPAEVMIHLGGIAHELSDRQDAAAYRAANAQLPLELARACAAAGYQRFIFVSTAKVVGETTRAPADEDIDCHPQGVYAQAKREAELALARLAPETAMEVVVVRPPLVHGPGVGANFARLLRFAAGPLPWPGTARGARRSLIFLDNLVDALLFLGMREPAAAGTIRTCHVADGPALPLEEIVAVLRRALGRPARRIRVPGGLVRGALALPVAGTRLARIFGSLELDAGRMLAAGWQPPTAAVAALEQTALAWRARQQDDGRRMMRR